MNQAPVVLVVDDDRRLKNLIVRHLQEAGFASLGVESAVEADSLFQLLTVDAVVMDVMMPGKSGLDYLKELREKGVKTPILMLTAMGDVAHRIKGLEHGADDYMAKPFEPKELILRLKRLIKQTGQTQKHLLGGYVLALDAGTLTKGETVLMLTTQERELLSALSKKEGPVSRAELVDLLGGENERMIDVLITRFRKKINAVFPNAALIQTVRGQGYTLMVE